MSCCACWTFIWVLRATSFHFYLNAKNFDMSIAEENINEKKNTNLRIRTEMFLNLIDEALEDRMQQIIESVLDVESLKVAQPFPAT